MSALRRYGLLLIHYLRPMWPRVLILTVFLMSGIAVQLVNPQIIRFFIDTAQSGGSGQALFVAALIYFAFALARQVLAVLTTYISEKLAWTATNQLRADLALHCLRLDMSFHKAHVPGELIDRVDGDVTTLANFFSQLVIRVAGNLILALGILFMLFWEDWRFGVAGLSYVLLLFVILRQAHGPTARRWGEARTAHASLFGFIEERLVGTEDIRANGAGSYLMRRLYELMRDLLHKQRRASLMGSFTFISGWALYVLTYVAALALGVYLYLGGQITLGTVYLVVYYIGSLEAPLNDIRRQVADLQRATASIERIEALFGLESQITSPESGARHLPDGAPDVVFDKVSFAYDGRKLVLDGISFELGAGKVLGLLGRTGSGKTTLTRLLFRLYDPSAGAIRLGGVAIRDADLTGLRQHIGMVTQDVQLFAATVRDNLTFFNKRIPDGQLLDVIGSLGLSGWLASLPEGLDTKLDAGGKGLSAGEAQLLAFARVFLRDPRLVILDEASSRLDPVTERLVDRAIDRLLAGRTGIIIAHRLGTVDCADDVLILEDGQICEHGPRYALANDPASVYAGLLRTGLQEVLA
jgi:ATP-binding cassette subfamily B protein